MGSYLKGSSEPFLLSKFFKIYTTMIIMAPISIGELLDKITILTIKVARISDPLKIENIIKELVQLRAIADELKAPLELNVYYKQLLMVNQDLWDIEDNKRKHEQEQRFDDEFIKLARQVYLKNDYRAELKKKINLLMGSTIVEEKSY
jgi:hypothetical protein